MSDWRVLSTFYCGVLAAVAGSWSAAVFSKIKNRKIFVDFVGKCNKVCPFKFMVLLSAEFFATVKP